MRLCSIFIASTMMFGVISTVNAVTCGCSLLGTLQFEGAEVPGNTVSIDDVEVNIHYPPQVLTISAECTYPTQQIPGGPGSTVLTCSVDKKGNTYSSRKSNVRFGASTNLYLCDIVLPEALRLAYIPEDGCNERK